MLISCLKTRRPDVITSSRPSGSSTNLNFQDAFTNSLRIRIGRSVAQSSISTWSVNRLRGAIIVSRELHLVYPSKREVVAVDNVEVADVRWNLNGSIERSESTDDGTPLFLLEWLICFDNVNVGTLCISLTQSSFSLAVGCMRVLVLWFSAQGIHAPFSFDAKSNGYYGQRIV